MYPGLTGIGNFSTLQREVVLKKQARGVVASKGEELTESGNMFERRPRGLSHARPVERSCDSGQPLISRMFSHFEEKVSRQRRGERPSGAQPDSGLLQSLAAIQVFFPLGGNQRSRLDDKHASWFWRMK